MCDLIDSSFDSVIAQTNLLSLYSLFKLIWKWKGMEWIKCFLWPAASNAPHTNEFPVYHHIANSPTCAHCSDGVNETILHALHDCPILGNFWHHLAKHSNWPNFFNANLHQWLLNLQANWLLIGHEWGYLFGTVLHFLWRIQNKEVFST